ncbi:Ras guanine nucleotide exchange factor [Ceratobasidium sp. AG-Ba]|nr:Ras guanine nucleotide exchange factor [Ceratobasidium sp. AG-Ba]
MGVGLRHSWHSLFVRLIRAVLLHPIAPTPLLLIMSKSVNSLQAPGAEDARGRPSVDVRISSGAPSVKSSSNSSGKSKEKKPRRNTSPVSFYAAPPMKRKTPTTPSKVKLPAPSVRSGASDETFDSTRTARPKVNSEPASLYHPAPLPSKKSKDLRSMSKSTLDLRTPTRDTFSVFSGSSGSGSANGTSSMSPSVASTSLSPSTPVSEEPKTGLRLPALSRRKSAPLHKPSVPPSSELPPVPKDQAPARVSSFRSAPRVQTPTTRDGNASDHVALAMPPQKVAPVVSTQPECVLGIIGSKGCGKSTLIKHAINAVETEESRIVAASADGPTMTLASTTFARGVVRILEINADELLDLSEIESDKWRLWPDGFPKLHGVAVCYDAQDEKSFNQAKQVLSGIGTSFTDPSFITLLIACKSDSLDESCNTPEIIPERGSKLGTEHGARFLRATHRTPAGVNQMVNAVQWMLDHLAKFRGTKRVIIIPRSKKSAPAPATTELPKSALARTRSAGDIISAWISDSSDASRPTPPVFHPPPPPAQEETPRHSIGEESLLSFGFPKVPNTLPSPIPEQVQQVPTPKPSEEAPQVRAPPLQLKIDGTPSEAPPRKQPAPLCMRWATPEELLDKLFFAGVSEDEPWFTFNFFLTYRLFMTPRTVLLSFQKRLRDLDEYSDDPILAGFVQQRLCELLQSWIEDYPNDFAAPGAPSALAAVVRTACENTHLMYYGSEFTYFLDELPGLTDDAASWAFVSADTPIEDADSVYEFDLDFNHDFDHGLFGDGQVLFDPGYSVAGAVNGNAAPVEEPIAPEASRSPPVTASDFGGRRLTRNESIQDEMGVRGMSPDARRGVSPVIKMLASVAMQLLEYSPAQVADEITRLETELFLKIKPRDWVRRGVKEDKLGKPKSIIEMNAFFDRIGKWVMSLVVSLNRAQERARLVTHLCEVAHHLRNLNNYSSLRAFHVGINCVCEQGDVVQSQVPSTVWRKYQSADKLLRVNENHLLYRMAVKNTFGAGIPSLEVHSSDLTRIGEMPSTNAEGHIHWAKFTHLGNNIHEINGFQERIREDGQYAFEPNMSLMRLISDPELLDMDTIYERCSQVDRDLQGGYPVPMPTSTASRIHKYLRR